METNLRNLKDVIEEETFNNENVLTETGNQQVIVEESVCPIFKTYMSIADLDPSWPPLDRKTHIAYLKHGLSTLSKSYQVLDASRPWLVYWILHSLELLEEPITTKQSNDIVDFLARCQNPDGGFAGGPGQLSHLAPTYAAINSLCIIGTKEAYEVINRPTLYRFLWSVKQKDGSFIMQKGGEVDIRGTYCALSCARLVNIFTNSLFENTTEWLLSCQTYEGGFSGVPGMEAHGGYTFCGLAALCLLNKAHLVNLDSLLRWTVNRQMRLEGGFQGRTNKLVDGCYSFWQGGIFPLLHGLLGQSDSSTLSNKRWLFHQEALQEYILLCCQMPSGGFLDKPKKSPDYYHTCYVLSGLSVAQHFSVRKDSQQCVIGSPSNQLAKTHPVFNICMDAAGKAAEYFSKVPPIEAQEEKS